MATGEGFMRIAFFLILAALVWISTQSHAAEKFTCKIETGYGTAIGFGETKRKATENAREICGEKMMDGYIAQRGRIPAEAEDDIIDLCVNKNCI
jgi:hypothetical protein